MMDIFFMNPGFTFEGIIIIFFHENGFDGSINSEYILWYECHVIYPLFDIVLSTSFFTNHSWGYATCFCDSQLKSDFFFKFCHKFQQLFV